MKTFSEANETTHKFSSLSRPTSSCTTEGIGHP